MYCDEKDELVFQGLIKTNIDSVGLGLRPPSREGNRMSIKQKLLLSPLILVAGMVVFAVQASKIPGLVHQNAVQVEMAGKMRMMNQKIFKETLMTVSGREADWRATQTEMLHFLTLLSGGGKGKNGDVVQPAQGETARTLALEHEGMERLFDALAVLRKKGKLSGKEFEQAWEAHEAFRQQAQEGVESFVRFSNQKFESLLTLSACVAVVTVASSLIASWLTGVRLSTSLMMILMQMEKLAVGDLSAGKTAWVPLKRG